MSETLATTPTTPTPEDMLTPTEEVTGVQAFTALGLIDGTLRAVEALGFSEPTAIQTQTIPSLLAGRDVIAQAPTGTGKTAAYGLPIIQNLNDNELHPQALIIVPTRELAMQVSEAMHTFGKYREIVTLPIYGGAPYERQLRALARGVQVVVGTPGRLLDHLRRDTLKLGDIRHVVLDEADEMLNMGFIEDIETLLAGLPKDHQSALFSATIPPRVAHLAERFLRDPVRVSITPKAAIAPRVRQVYYEVQHQAKPEALARILDVEEPQSVIVFVRTRIAADEVAERLNSLGYIAQSIHGEINQAQRERVLERFRAGRTQILVATDVAARGLDIPDVSHIINYDLPLDSESYVHRIGRTGRAGKGGEALTLVTPRERRQLRYMEQAIRHRLQQLRLPTEADVAARRRATFREEVLKILDGGQLDPYLKLVEELAGSRDPAEVAAAAFKMAAKARETARPGSGVSWTEMAAGPGIPATPVPANAFPTNAPPMPPRPSPILRAPKPVVPTVPPRTATPEFDTASADEPAPAALEADQAASGELPAPRKSRSAARKADRERPTELMQMVKLFLRVGRQHGARPADIVGAIANEAGIPGDIIGDIDIYDTFSFVEIPDAYADFVRGALSRTMIRGQKPRARLAQPDDRLGDHTEDDRDLGASGVFEAPRPSRAPSAKPYQNGRKDATRTVTKRPPVKSERRASTKRHP